ncbi:glycerophosphoryl diester phosphodiesterase membrane domain-containing protein [Curtobacterium sp. MCPF17_050]|uniref:glycerophosphoryl diester phosphodiesterase membrane domain-containing protein n=1 Tax=Curtobacterium sp. MCPF17_050 TaxID=2175664 RepID=UPI000D96FD18|nr:glycerophosphoryl diester phosphodiesterase membrane domain-containing protein [Curtobacterium sp. MCPF17_050]WIB14494.1 glycerophosphoryl diester phosphodiesterase membrane domain-containing protein [Curtobacterium sp. MCPF17_050]
MHSPAWPASVGGPGGPGHQPPLLPSVGGPDPQPVRPVIPLRPLGLGDVLAGAFTVFRRNARVLLLWAVLLSGVLGLVSTLTSAFGQRTLQSRMLAAVDGTGDADTIIAGTVTLYAVLSIGLPFLAYLARGFLVAPIAVDTGQRVLGRRGTFRGLWALLAGRRRSVLGWILLQLAGGVVLGTVFVLVVLAFVAALSAGDGAVGWFVLTIVVMVLGFAVLVAFFTTRFAFTVPTIALEGRGVFSAAGQSWRLTRGAFWRTFGILLLVQVVLAFAASIASIPLTVGLTLFSGVFDPLGQTGSSTAGGPPSVGAVVTLAIGSLLVIAVQCVTDVLTASITTFLTIDRRIRTEALDQRIAAHLETGQPADPFAPSSPGDRQSWSPRQGWPQQQGWPEQQGWQQQGWQQQGWPEQRWPEQQDPPSGRP